jgi:WD40 repeat protein/DNA-binding winged helix-turn-helix (wHTH) protein
MQVERAQKIEAQFRVADWLVEPSLNRVSRDGVAVQLELKAMDVLLCLAGRPGELVDKHELVDAVWQTEFVADNTLTRRIADLRDALGDDARNPHYIETIPKRGYRLIAEVAFFDGPSADPDTALARTQPDEVSPYPGLEPFTEADTDNFFGREAEITTLWRRITNCRLLAVIGPSGAGKSSLLRAGVIARAPPGWRAVHCQPGEDPILALARALAPDLAGDAEELRQLLAFNDPDIALAVSARWRGRWDEALLVVDQFEELFTLNPEPVQERFVELLRRLVDAAGIHVVLVLRDDFLLECHRYPKLAPIFNHQTPVGPPAATELRRALTEPAARHLYGFESELLVDEMIGDVESERGALPALAFAVSRLWELRDCERRMLTREGYEEIGGVGGALAQHAEATLDVIGQERLPIVREIFRNLVTAQGTRATRQWDDLLSIFNRGGREGVKPSPTDQASNDIVGAGFTPARDVAQEVLAELIDARLLTSFEVGETEEGPTRRVEIVHESLLGAWSRLVRWQTQDADAAQLRDQLRQAAQLWRAKGKADDLLWSGRSFREFVLWREGYPGGLSDTEEAFAKAMIDNAGRRRRRRRLVVAAVLLATLTVAVVTTSLWRRSEHHARRVEARRLAEIARQTMDGSPPEAFAFAMASLEIADGADARRLALQALWRSPMPAAVDTNGLKIYTIWAVFSPDGRWLATSNAGGMIHLWPPDGGDPISWQAHQTLTTVKFSPEPDAILSQALAEPKRVFWSVPGGVRLGEIDATMALKATHVSAKDGHTFLRMTRIIEDPRMQGTWTIDHRPSELRQKLQEGHPPRAALGPDGRDLVFSLGSDLYIADVERPGTEPRAIGGGGAEIKQIAFRPDGSHFATIDFAGVVSVWTLSDGASVRIRSWQGLADDDSHHIDFDPSGDFVTVSYDMGDIHVYGLNDPPGAEPLRLRPQGSRVIHSEFDPSGRWLATASMGRLAVWPIDRSRYPFVLRGHSGSVDKIEFGPGGEFLVSTGTDGTVRLWPLRPDTGAEPRIIHDWGGPIDVFIASLSVSDDGRLVVATGDQKFVRVIPLDGSPAYDLGEADQRVTRTAVSPDGRLVAVLGLFDGRNAIRVWDLESGAVETVDLPEKPDWPPLSYPLEFTADGRLVTSFASRVRAWDPETHEMRYLLDGVWTIALNGDGRRLIGRPGLAGAGESVATVYDLESGSSTRLTSHGSDVISLALDPTGTIAVTGDRRGNLRVGPASGESPQILTMDDVPAYTVAVSPDGRWIASGHFDGTIRLWPMPDITKPPLHELPHAELLSRLEALTNLRVVPDPDDPGGYVVRAGPFPGWETVPSW